MRSRYSSHFVNLPTFWILLFMLSVLATDYGTGGYIHDRLMHFQQAIYQFVDHAHRALLHKKQLLAKIQHLEDRSDTAHKQVAQLRYDISQHQTIISENKHLRRMLGIKAIVRHPLFTQPIRISRSLSDHSVIAKRPQGAVSAGMLALNEEGIVIGRVASVTQSTLRILMLNDMKSALPVVVSDQYVNAVAVGNGQGVDLLHMPIDSAIKSGDVVRTVQTFPDGVNYQTLGQVASVQASPDRTFLIAKLSQSTMLTSLQWLILI